MGVPDEAEKRTRKTVNKRLLETRNINQIDEINGYPNQWNIQLEKQLSKEEFETLVEDAGPAIYNSNKYKVIIEKSNFSRNPLEIDADIVVIPVVTPPYE